MSEDINVGAISEALNNKMDRDTLNASDTGNINMAGLGMPSDKYIDFTLNASGSTYTAPANGWFLLWLQTNSEQNINHSVEITVNGREYGNTLHGGGMRLYAYFPILKGEIATISYARIASTNQFRFYYAQGSESEAS